MSKKYEEPKPTGREYVDATKEFHLYTVSTLCKLPDKWRPYVLDPVFKASEAIVNYVLAANKVYVNAKTLAPMELSSAYSERAQLLTKAMRWFDVFDEKFEIMTGCIDLVQAESKRLKGILENYIRKDLEKMAQENPQVSYNVEVRQHIDRIDYVTASGTQSVRLGLNARKKDYWVSLEYEAKKQVSARLTKDRAYIKSLGCQ